VKETKVSLDFTAPKPGVSEYTLYFMCDSYAGCDQEFEFQINVKEGKAVELEGERDGMDTD